MNILITGAFGFVGTNISKQLSKTANLCLLAVDIHQPDKHCYNKYYSWDELNKIDWSEIDVIIHLAGKAHDTRNTTDEKTYHKINVGLTQIIFDYFLTSSANMFIFFSSVKAVADKIDGELLEKKRPNPATSYGRSKLKAEDYINENLSKDRTIIILRPCMIHGPGNKGNLNLLHSIIEKGIPWPLGSYDNSRSFLYIENLCFVIKEILKGKVSSGVYNVADDEALSTMELVSIIAEVSNIRSRIWDVPKTFIQMIAKAGNLLPLPLNEERLEKLTENYLVSNEKIKQELGIEKMPVSAKKGMLKTLKSFETK